MFVSEGEHVQTDTCCREHDHCPSTIPSFRRRFGIVNYYPMHMSLCSCENRLYNCLWNITSSVSVAVGRLYFNVFRAPCFQLVEVKVCKKRSFNWKKFKFVCKEYGTELKGKKFKIRKFLKEFSVQPDMNSRNTTKPMLQNDTCQSGLTLHLFYWCNYDIWVKTFQWILRT